MWGHYSKCLLAGLLCRMEIVFSLIISYAGANVFAQSNYVANGANSFTPGTFNTLVGPGAGSAGPLTGQRNSFFGYNAGAIVNSGSYNALIGVDAGRYLTSGSQNVFMGYTA